jgi:hypothetical protein
MTVEVKFLIMLSEYQESPLKIKREVGLEIPSFSNGTAYGGLG